MTLHTATTWTVARPNESATTLDANSVRPRALFHRGRMGGWWPRSLHLSSLDEAEGPALQLHNNRGWSRHELGTNGAESSSSFR